MQRIDPLGRDVVIRRPTVQKRCRQLSLVTACVSVRMARQTFLLTTVQDMQSS